MFDFQNHLVIKMSNKNYQAMLAFLKKNGGGKKDVSRFIEDAVAWCIFDRELALRHLAAREPLAFVESSILKDQDEYYSA